MKNLQLAKKIKALRKQRGYSQEVLSERSELNLRTIQRIEAGDTEARGDTLQRLAHALQVSANDLADYTEDEDRPFLTLLNLSSLSFIAFPLLGIIVPLALWVVKKGKIRDLDKLGKRLLNFQILWCIVMCIPYILFVVFQIFHLDSSFLNGLSILNFGGFEMLVILIPLLYLINIIYVFFNSYRSYKGKLPIYQPAIPFLR
jgi:uncharacterized Tic20 family protein